MIGRRTLSGPSPRDPSGPGPGPVLGSREPDLKSQPSGFKLGSLSKCAASDSATLQFRASDTGRARSSCNGASLSLRAGPLFSNLITVLSCLSCSPPLFVCPSLRLCPGRVMCDPFSLILPLLSVPFLSFLSYTFLLFRVFPHCFVLRPDGPWPEAGLHLAPS